MAVAVPGCTMAVVQLGLTGRGVCAERLESDLTTLCGMWSCDLGTQQQSHPSGSSCHVVERPGAMVLSVVMSKKELLQLRPGSDANVDDCLYFVPLLREAVTDTAV